MGKLVERKKAERLPEAGGQKKGMLLLNSIYAGNDGKVLSIDRVMGTHSIMNIFNATDLYTYQWLKYYIHLNTNFFKKRVLKTKF